MSNNGRSYKTTLPDDEVKRKLFRSSVDGFAKFRWRNIDMWEVFGAFIINNKGGSLKFYNGPSFSNEYTKPQFGDTHSLTGINFQIQKISFMVGMYWFTSADWSKFIAALDPYIIDYLTFDFASEYAYQVKLSKVGDSTRYIVGRGKDGEPRYYTELSLEFEVQGAQCVYYSDMYKFTAITPSNSNAFKTSFDNSNKNFSNKKSGLPTPLVWDFTLTEKDGEDGGDLPTGGKVRLEGKFSNANNTNNAPLFDFYITNWSFANGKDINFEYDSESGLIYWKYGNEKYKLLSLINTTSSGKRIIENLVVNRFLLDGEIGSEEDYEGDFTITLSYYNNNGVKQDITPLKISSNNNISCRGRTNVF